MLTDKQQETLWNTKGICHYFGSPFCWCKPTMSTDDEFIVMTHHYEPEALDTLRRLFPDQTEFGVVRIPMVHTRIALATAQKMSDLTDGTYKEH